MEQAVRIVFMQSTTMFTNFYSDQLKADIEREERVEKKEITRRQADREEEEWMEVRMFMELLVILEW
jgi:hypothetical protein